MKKIYLLMTLFLVMFASCSKEEAVPESGSGDVTISVDVPTDNVLSRAVPTADGMDLRCIMQVVDENGAVISGENMKQVQKVTGETVTFSFKKPAVKYSVVFWADYVTSGSDINTDNIYKTESLPDVTYNKVADDMFADAADAFCGVLAEGETAVTLKRPFSKIVVGSTSTDFNGYSEVEIGEFSVPTGYSILNKTTTGTQDIKLAKKAMENAATGVWASFFRFASVSEAKATISLPITVYNGENTITFTADAEKALDPNVIANINVPNAPEDPDKDKINVDISFDDTWEKVNSVKVGDYINASGEVVSEIGNAVAVVFALADGKTDNSTYADGKKPVAYAFSLKNATPRSDLMVKLNEYGITAETADDYSGYKFDAAIKTALNGTTDESVSKLYARYYSSKSLADVSKAANLSSWYLPSVSQLLDALAYVNTNSAVLDSFKNLYSGKDYFITTSSVCTVDDYQTTYGVMYSNTNSAFNSTSGKLKPTTSVFAVPVVTILEAAK